MKSIFKVHTLTYFLIIISLLSGKFKIISLYLLIILVHELGHLLTAILFNWKIDKIYIYPLGGITKFNDRMNKPLLEELLVTLMGPVFQVVFTNFVKDLDLNILLFSNTLLLFNLLPIVPLDGGRLLNILFFYFKPIKKSIKTMIKISYITYFIMLLYVIRIKSFFFLLVIFLLIFKIHDESKRGNYYFDIYLLEKYLYVIKYKRNSIIPSIKNIYKYRNNYIKIGNKLYNEKDYINQKIIVMKQEK